MLIACLVVIGVLVAFVLATFFITLKNYKFSIEDGLLRVQNIGSHLRIYFNNSLIKDIFSPHLFDGEKVEFMIGEKQFSLNCQTNYWGNKLSVEIFEGDKVLATNGVEIKKKSK